ncbi:MAG: response regulator transcription factor [Arenimonas sp.]|nr:response regulator transcription factor [Arenimonas sp.]
MRRILLIDDHAIVREGFKRLFDGSEDFTVVGEAADAESALSLARSLQPDIAVIDLNLGAGRSGLEIIPQLAAVAPAMKRVVLSMHDDTGLVLRALDSGAHGYVTKAVAHDELQDLLRRLDEGGVVLSSDLSASSRGARPSPKLTDRECDTLRGLLSGRPPKVIASDMGISDKTLYRHRANLMEKLGARSQGDLVRIAREQGLLLDTR